ncbi:PREDICTED: uncharacterized protein LOC109477910 [Branchiostoma belcheri]|uniref:Uncharacterized protein LOC109477910 n=1 Tax=Branchiostoma belcheri TaxID=7741 RepID=A0A6P4ZLM8_BRABE|nr:PREDICTED: uncharacterized protein LOC109477910 [Branchiostoma belcheri]
MSRLKSEASRDPEGRLRGECLRCHKCAAYCPKPGSNVCKSCSHVARDHALLEACHMQGCNCPECVIVKNVPGECANCGHKVTAHTPTRDMKVARMSSRNDEAVPSTSSMQPAGTSKTTKSFHQWLQDEDSEEEFEKSFLPTKKKKETDRKRFFQPKGKGKGKGQGKAGKKHKFNLSMLSEQGSTVAHSCFGISVSEWNSEQSILELAGQKLLAMRKIGSDNVGHLLLCEGDGAWLKYVPGTVQPFVVRDYLEFRGIPSSKIHLYVMTRTDYIVLQKSKPKLSRDQHWKEARLPEDDEHHSDDTKRDEAAEIEIVDSNDDEIYFPGPRRPRTSTPLYDETVAMEDLGGLEDPNEDRLAGAKRVPDTTHDSESRVPDTTHDYEYAKMLQLVYDNEASEYANSDTDEADFSTSRELADDASGGAETSSMEPWEKKDLLKKLVNELHEKNIKKTQTKLYNVRRDKVWPSLKEKIARKTFDPFKAIEVKFIGEEETIDQGGPKNEMFRLALDGIFSSSGLFELTAQGFLPVSSPIALYNEEFVTVGKALAMSIVHFGPSPTCLHPAVVAVVCDQKLPDMSAFKPVDKGTADFVEKLEKATKETLPSLLQSDIGMSMLSVAGWRKTAASTSIEETVVIRRALCLQDIVVSRKSAIEQLREGLKLFGLLSVLESEPHLAGSLLLKSTTPITSDDVVRSLSVHWAEDGSNRKDRQKDVYQRLTTWLECVEEGDGRVSLKHFLTYVTAQEAEPVTGWQLEPVLQFKVCPAGCGCYPVSNTCALTLTMPEHMANLSQQEFDCAMEEAIVGGWGFGRE